MEAAAVAAAVAAADIVDIGNDDYCKAYNDEGTSSPAAASLPSQPPGIALLPSTGLASTVAVAGCFVAVAAAVGVVVLSSDHDCWLTAS